MRKYPVFRKYLSKPTRQSARFIDIVDADDPRRSAQRHSDEVTAGTGSVRLGRQTSVHVAQIGEHAVVRFDSLTNQLFTKKPTGIL